MNMYNQISNVHFLKAYCKLSMIACNTDKWLRAG